MLTAFQIQNKDDFPHEVSRVMKAAGYQVKENGYAIEAYRPGLEWSVPGIGNVLGGCRLTRLSGGGGRWICLLPHWSIPRLDLTSTDRARVDKIVTTSKEFSAAGRMEECFSLLQKSGFTALPENEALSVATAGRVILGSGTKPLGAISFPLLKGKPLQPASRAHLLCTAQTFTKSQLDGFAKRVSSTLDSFGVSVAPRCLDFNTFLRSLTSLTPGKVQNQSIVLIGVSGSRTDKQPIPEETYEAFRLMNRLNIPYRVFAQPSLNNSFAVNDMAPYLAMLLGASVREVELAPAFAKTLFLGMDLGHPLHRGNSVPVLSVVDSRGRLLAWWRGLQIRDETLRRETTQRATSWLLDWLSQTGNKPVDMIILRDGKLNKNDGLDEMASAMPCPTTIVEVVKNPVPLMRHKEMLAKPGTWIEVVPGLDGFLQMPQPTLKGHIARPLRLRKASTGDFHTLEDIAGAVFTLCHAPTLGLRTPSAPVPIYWSDGLAANSGGDLQFRGLNHVPHHDEILGSDPPSKDAENPVAK